MNRTRALSKITLIALAASALWANHCQLFVETKTSQCSSHGDCPNAFPRCTEDHICARASDAGTLGGAGGGIPASSSGGQAVTGGAGGQSAGGGATSQPPLGGAGGRLPMGGAGGQLSFGGAAGVATAGGGGGVAGAGGAAAPAGASAKCEAAPELVNQLPSGWQKLASTGRSSSQEPISGCTGPLADSTIVPSGDAAFADRRCLCVTGTVPAVPEGQCSAYAQAEVMLSSSRAVARLTVKTLGVPEKSLLYIRAVGSNDSYCHRLSSSQASSANAKGGVSLDISEFTENCSNGAAYPADQEVASLGILIGSDYAAAQKFDFCIVGYDIQ